MFVFVHKVLYFNKNFTINYQKLSIHLKSEPLIIFKIFPIETSKNTRYLKKSPALTATYPKIGPLPCIQITNHHPNLNFSA